jgi:serine/threonine protein kinase
MNPVPRHDETAPRGQDPHPHDEAAAPASAARRDDALLPGSRVDQFEIERVLATSGFGLVYLATDHAVERRVAIKEYLPDSLAVRAEDGVHVRLRADSHAEAFERGRRAFVEEAQLLARLEHPSLLRVLRHWDANGTVYRAMPYYPGTQLLRLREAMGTPPDEATLRALIDGLLEPLALLHAQGCVHREIAPGSILLLPDDRPVLMDWGAARRAIVGDQARALMTLLAPSFAPLEVTAPTPDRPIGPWTDLYELGAVVRYCVSGQLPPPAALRTMPADEPIGRMLARLRLVNPSLHYSPSFIAAIDAALMPRPEDRPQSVDELRALLDDHPAAIGERIEPGFDTAADSWGEESRPPLPPERPEPSLTTPTTVTESRTDAWMSTIIQPHPHPHPHEDEPEAPESRPHADAHDAPTSRPRADTGEAPPVRPHADTREAPPLRQHPQTRSIPPRAEAREVPPTRSQTYAWEPPPVRPRAEAPAPPPWRTPSYAPTRPSRPSRRHGPTLPCRRMPRRSTTSMQTTTSG